MKPVSNVLIYFISGMISTAAVLLFVKSCSTPKNSIPSSSIVKEKAQQDRKEYRAAITQLDATSAKLEQKLNQVTHHSRLVSSKKKEKEAAVLELLKGKSTPHELNPVSFIDSNDLSISVKEYIDVSREADSATAAEFLVQSTLLEIKDSMLEVKDIYIQELQESLDESLEHQRVLQLQNQQLQKQVSKLQRRGRLGIVGILAIAAGGILLLNQ